jgi:AmmeMemoRadiSam system protein B
MFYAADSTELAGQVGGYLRDGASATANNAGHAKAIIVPHAGYIYSGLSAAKAYAELARRQDRISRVVLLGPTHRVPVRGLAVPSVRAFSTPLGEVPIAHDVLAGLSDLPQVKESDAVHAWEHSLEVQLPFLQTVLARFDLVPLAVGDASAHDVEQVLDRLWGGEETLIVVSSDLSHYHSYAEAQRIDHETARQILELAPIIEHRQACGATPINGLLLSARHRGLKPVLVDLRNSGDTAGDKMRVVGYGAFVFS